MSIQDVIDRHMSEEGRYQRTIVINKEAGSASIPNNCHVEMHDCTLGSVSVGMGCSVHILKSVVGGTITMTSGQLTIDDSVLNQEVLLQGVKLSQSKCVCNFRHQLIGGSLFGHSNQRHNFGASPTLELLEGARAELREDEFTQTGDLALEAKEKSRAKLYECKMLADVNGVHLDESRLEFLGGVFKGLAGYGILAENKSNALFSDINDEPPFFGLTYAIEADSSKVSIFNTEMIHGIETAIYARNGAIVSISDFKKLDSASSHTVLIEMGAKVEIQKGDIITSPASHVFVLLAGKAAVRDVLDVISLGGTAFSSNNGSNVNVSGIVQITGVPGSGIEAGDGDLYTLKDIDTLKGEGKDAITAGNGCSFKLEDIKSVVGDSGNGITFGNDCVLNATRIKKIRGNVRDAINGGNENRITLLKCNEISGVINSVILKNKSSIRINEVKEIKGETRSAIEVGDDSSVRATKYELIEGIIGDGIKTGSRGDVALTFGTLVKTDMGAAIKSESKGTVLIHECDEVMASEGAAIKVISGTLSVYATRKVSGGGTGFNLSEGTSAEVQNVEIIYGGEHGFKVADSSVRVSGISKIEGGINGVWCINSDVKVSNIKNVLGTNAFAINGGHAEFRDCIGDGKATVEDNGDTIFVGCAINDDLTQSSGSVRCQSTTITKGVSITGGTIRLSNVVVEIGLASSGSSVFGESLNVGGEILMQGSSGSFYLTSASGLVALDSSIFGSGCSWGSPTIDGSYFHMGLDGIFEVLGNDHTTMMKSSISSYSPTIYSETDIAQLGVDSMPSRSIRQAVLEELRTINTEPPFTLPLTIGSFSPGDPLSLGAGGWDKADNLNSGRGAIGIVTSVSSSYVVRTTPGIYSITNHGLGVPGEILWLGQDGSYINSEPTGVRTVQTVLQIIDDNNVILFPETPFSV